MRLGYIVCSAFSGSTLLSFLVNLHPAAVSAGHSTGWAGLTPEFQCSCGDAVEQCPFFSHVRARFAEQGLAFPLAGFFPNAYRIGSVERVNQILFGKVPGLGLTGVEAWRDRLVRGLPGLASRIRRIERSNLLFFEAACEYAGASVYVDNSHSPHRLRQLARIPSLEPVPVHLVRDPRGVVLSDTEVYGWSTEFAARHWIGSQENMVRNLLASGVDRDGDYSALVMRYEGLCDEPLSVLNRYFARLDLPPLESLGDFKRVEHHVLGNRMRFGSGRIEKSERWRRDLDTEQQRRVVDIVTATAARSRYRTELECLLEAALA